MEEHTLKCPFFKVTFSHFQTDLRPQIIQGGRTWGSNTTFTELLNGHELLTTYSIYDAGCVCCHPSTSLTCGYAYDKRYMVLRVL